MTEQVTLAETQGYAGFHVEVKKEFNGSPTPYRVFVNNVDKHGECSADDVVRALTHYINGITHKLEKAGGKV